MQRVTLFGAVADGLAVAADGADFCVRCVGRAEQRLDRRGIELRQPVAGQLRAVQLVRAGRVQRQQFVSQRIVEGLVMPGKQLGLRSAQVGEGGIDTVQAGAGHQPHIQFRRMRHGVAYLIEFGEIGIAQQVQARHEIVCRLLERRYVRRADGLRIGQCDAQRVALLAVDPEFIV